MTSKAIEPAKNLVISEDGIHYAVAPTIEEAAADLENLRRAGVFSKFAWAYVARYVQETFGADAYNQMIDESMYEPATIRNTMSVANLIFPANQSIPVRWSHFVIAATIKDEATQRYWLERVLSEKLTREQLWNLINPPAIPEEQVEFFRPVNDRSLVWLVEAWFDGRTPYSKKDMLGIIQQYLEENKL